MNAAYLAPYTGAASSQKDDIFVKIERLAELRQKGILTDQELNAKKQDLPSQI